MLQTFTNTSMPGQLAFGQQNGSIAALPEGGAGIFSGVLVNILKDLNVLQENLILTEGQETPVLVGSILPQQAELINEALPLDGNDLPLELLDSDILSGIAVMQPLNQERIANQALSDGNVDAEIHMLGLQRRVMTQKELISSAMVSDKHVSPVLTMATSAPTLVEQPDTVLNQSTLALLNHRLQQAGNEKGAFLTGQGAFAKSINELLGGNGSNSQVQGVSLSSLGLNLEKPAALVPNVTQVTIHTPMGQAGWDQELGNRVTWMLKQNIPMAQIKITPANLGPIEVKISVSNDQATVTMVAAHATTRDALELAMPRLRDMLTDAGLTLANANVFSQSQQQGGQGGRQTSGQSVVDDGGDAKLTGTAADEQIVSSGVNINNGIVDIFA